MPNNNFDDPIFPLKTFIIVVLDPSNMQLLHSILNNTAKILSITTLSLNQLILAFFLREPPAFQDISHTPHASYSIPPYYVQYY